MRRRRVLIVAGVLLWVGLSLGPLRSAGSTPFDKLSDTDRNAFAGRFEREVWPLLVRGGKNGCVGCHGAKHRSPLRFTGKADDDFRALLKEGFLLADDPGNLVARIETKDRKAKMPPGKRPAWPAADAQILRQFIADVDKAQKR
jgi:hypothetical protein